MKINEAVAKAINDQIQREFFSAYIYLSMSAYFESMNLSGFASWMRLQSIEETKHAMKFFDYVNDRGGRVKLEAMQEPPWDFESPLAVFRQALEHEQQVTAAIHDLYRLAQDQKDYATQAMLQWFITEQVEEEKSAAAIVDKLELIGTQQSLLLILDQELAGRTPEAEE